MAWFHHTLQDSSQPDPSPINLTTNAWPQSGIGAAQPLTGAVGDGQPRLCPPSGSDLLPVVQPAVLPSLGELSTTSSVHLSYVTLQEQRCVVSWFLGWAPAQRQRFLQDLISKAVPGKVSSLLEQLNTLQVKDRPPNIFECQLRLWTQWFETWSEEERNFFLNSLEEKDPDFVAHFYRCLAGTAGRD